MARTPRTGALLAAGVVALAAAAAGVALAGAATPKQPAATTAAKTTAKAPAPRPGTAAARAADLKAGAALFAANGCAACHALAAARSSAYRAPDLDALGLPAARIVRQLTQGSIGMPSFRKRLTPTQIGQIARYVATVSKAGSKSPRDAATLYRGYCGMCHSLAGPNVKGVTGPPLDGHGYSVDDVIGAIVQKHPLTMGFGVDLEGSEVQAIAAYVVAQQQGAPAATAAQPTITAQG